MREWCVFGKNAHLLLRAYVCVWNTVVCGFMNEMYTLEANLLFLGNIFIGIIHRDLER